MKTKFVKLIAVASVLFVFQLSDLAWSQETMFSYQGRLNSGTNVANGMFDFRFKLYSDSSGNNPVGSVQLTNGVGVQDGLFLVAIDFGAGTFAGSNYWLGLEVRSNGVANFSPLMPYQAITPTPYAIFANTANNLVGDVTVTQLGSGATSASSTGTVVLRDINGGFSAGTIAVTNIVLPANIVTIYSGTNTLLYSGSNNLFLGPKTGNGSSGYQTVGVGINVLRNTTSTAQGNTGLGYSALAANAGGAANTAIGWSALQTNQSGYWNTAVGSGAMFGNIVGFNNTAVGVNTMVNNSGGYENTAVGVSALNANANGIDNTAMGKDSLLHATGQQNTGFGWHSMYWNTSGSYNTSVGADCLSHYTTGSFNTAVGVQALYWTPGTNSIGIGYLGGFNAQGNNNIEIGNQGLTADNGVIRIGSLNQQTNTFIAGISGVSVANAGFVMISPSGQLGTVGSVANVNLSGTFAGNGMGLTNVPASGITGGLTTNILIGNATFYITNGVIIRIQ